MVCDCTTDLTCSEFKVRLYFIMAYRSQSEAEFSTSRRCFQVFASRHVMVAISNSANALWLTYAAATMPPVLSYDE